MSARGPRSVVVLPLALLVMAVVAMLLLAAVAPALAQTPSAAPLPTPFDPRGGGTGPGLVGAPFVAALAVIVLGILASAATALYVRLARRP